MSERMPVITPEGALAVILKHADDVAATAIRGFVEHGRGQVFLVWHEGGWRAGYVVADEVDEMPDYDPFREALARVALGTGEEALFFLTVTVVPQEVEQPPLDV